MAGELSGIRHVLHDAAGLDQIIHKMARQASALFVPGERLVVVGVLRRGAPLADRLTEELVKSFAFPKPLRLDLSVKRYADDLTLLYPQTRLLAEPGQAVTDLSGYSALLVDDVIYGGFSLLKTTQYLVDRGSSRVVTACLADRQVAKVPICADICGLKLQMPERFVVEVSVPPYETHFQLALVEKNHLPFVGYE